MNDVHLKGEIANISTTNKWVWIATEWGRVRCLWPDDNAQLQNGFEALQVKDEILIGGHLVMNYASGGGVDSNSHVRITWAEALRPARRAKDANAWFRPRTVTIINNEMYSDWYEKRHRETREMLDKAREDARTQSIAAREKEAALEDMRTKYREAVFSGLIGGGSLEGHE